MRQLAHTPVFTALASIFAFSATAFAAPIATLDRDGAFVSIEAYGPNVVHVTIAVDKAEVLKGPGYGILPKNSDNSAFRHSGGKDGDVFTSPAMTVRVNPAPPPSVPTRARSTLRRRWRRSACRC
jgi:alpha-D-xyloside xylohydrolase